MVLPIDTESYSYQFYKNLNEDVKLKSDKMGRWDIDFDFENDDWYIVTGFNSVFNACVIAIMTRFNELDNISILDDEKSLYHDFGCRVHELIKANKNRNTIYYMELFVTEVLENMRRIRRVNWVTVEDNPNGEDYNYKINFNVSCRLDEGLTKEDIDTTIIEESFII